MIVDLYIAIICVYSAFYIKRYADQQKNARLQGKVLSSLKYELEYFKIRMKETALGMKGYSRELIAIRDQGLYGRFLDCRLIEPQYDD